MFRYIIRRLLALIPVLLGISVVVFMLIHLVPGDVVSILLGPTATAPTRDALRKSLGLDQPIYIQYFRWLGNVLQGNLGTSIRTGQPVLHEILQRFPVTLELTLLSMVLAVIIGIAAGVIGAIKQYSKVDYAVTIFALAGLSIPNFLLATIFILFFALMVRWLPPSGYVPFGQDPLENLKLMIMPALALGLGAASYVARMTRSSVLETLRQDYIRTAYAKGLRAWSVVIHHALKNALIPIVTVVGIQLGYLLGGAVIIETIYTLPGIGRLALDGINMRDYPVVQGTVLFITVVFVFINLAVDILYAYIDPRINYD
ncbi:MAG TPA: ABC transporter permease [Chloroflexota bacterium]|nr:ABC transporter permease [Chloroflexota bacterium]